MTETIRFPFQAVSKLGASEQFEIIQIVPRIAYPGAPDPTITTNLLKRGGGEVFDDEYGDIRPLKTDLRASGGDSLTILNQRVPNRLGYKVSPFTQVMIEFVSDTAQTIGNGTTDLIGLYGEIFPRDADRTATESSKMLLGILGLSLGAGLLPQIPLVAQAQLVPNPIVGYACMSCNVAVFDRLSVGGVTGDVACTNVRVIVRPIHNQSLSG